MDHEHSGGVIIVPHEALSADALAGVIDEFVSREGTDYGHVDYALERKRADVHRQLERGEVVITFERRTGTTTIVSRRDVDAPVRSRAGPQEISVTNGRPPAHD